MSSIGKHDDNKDARNHQYSKVYIGELQCKNNLRRKRSANPVDMLPILFS